MRIAVVHYQLARGGGMESYLADLVRGLAAAGDEVDVWARRIDADFAAELPVASKRVRVPPLPRLYRNRYFSRAVQRLHLIERYDLVLSLARTVGQDAYISGGDHLGYLRAMCKRPALRDRFEVRLERCALESSRCVVVHSLRLKREYEALYGVDADRIHVIYPPVDVARFIRTDAGKRRARRDALGLGTGDFAFLFPSTGHARKGLPALLAAFSRLTARHARLLIAGRPLGVGADPRIRSLGYVTDMPGLYSAVDCTILPSAYEPFGLVIAESLQCGTPVITTRDSGVAELMALEDGIRLESCAPAAILDALHEMLAQAVQPPVGWAAQRGLVVESHVQRIRRQCHR